MVGCARALHGAVGGARRLIRKSLQPENPRKENTHQHPLVGLKADNVRRLIGSEVINEHMFQITPSAGEVTEVKLRDADHSLAVKPIVRVGSLRGQG